MRNIIPAALLAACMPVLLAASNAVLNESAPQADESATQIKIQTYERWWGLDADAVSQPFSSPFSLTVSSESPVSMPAMFSNRGRIISSDTLLSVSFDGSALSVSSPGRTVGARKAGNTLHDVFRSYAYRRAATLPKPSAALCSSVIYQLDEKRIHSSRSVLDFARNILDAGFPTGYIIIPEGWRASRSGFQFAGDYYPDAALFIRELHELGFKIILTLDPYVTAAGMDYAAHIKDGDLIMGDDGKPAIIERDNGFFAVYDMREKNEPQSVRKAILALREEYAVDGFMFNGSAYDILYADDPELRTAALERWRVALEGIPDVISGFSGSAEVSGTYAFSLEKKATWQSMTDFVSQIIRYGLFGISGAAYVPETDRNERETVIRAAQLAMTMPVAILPDGVWSLPRADRESVRKIVQWRSSLAGYMGELAESSATSGEPMVRSMEYQFGGLNFYDTYDQFMLGSKYLVAPMLGEGVYRMVSLPRGTWLLPDGKVFRGPRVVNVNVSAGGFAVFQAQ